MGVAPYGKGGTVQAQGALHPPCTRFGNGAEFSVTAALAGRNSTVADWLQHIALRIVRPVPSRANGQVGVPPLPVVGLSNQANHVRQRFAAVDGNLDAAGSPAIEPGDVDG